LNDLINVFKSGKEIRHLLGMVLKLGNYMNGGNRYGLYRITFLSVEPWSADGKIDAWKGPEVKLMGLIWIFWGRFVISK